MKNEQAVMHNAAALGALGELHNGVLKIMESYLHSLLLTYPSTPRRLARIDAAIALMRGAVSQIVLAGHIMNNDRTGTEIADSLPVLDEILNESEKRVEAYIEAKRGDLTEQAFDDAELMADVVGRRVEAKRKNALLDEQSKLLGHALSEGVEVVAVTETGLVVQPHLTGKEVLVS